MNFSNSPNIELNLIVSFLLSVYYYYHFIHKRIKLCN